MASSRFNYQCITESGELKKYAAQSLSQIIDEVEDYNDRFTSILRQDLHSSLDTDYVELTWYD